MLGNHTWDHPNMAGLSASAQAAEMDRTSGLATDPFTGGYWILTSNGGVHNYAAPWYGSAAGTLPAAVTAVGLAADTASGGYLILKSNGGVANYHAPWYGSLTGHVPAGQSVTAITGQ
jgi:hypothetical protein